MLLGGAEWSGVSRVENKGMGKWGSLTEVPGTKEQRGVCKAKCGRC